MKDEDIRAEAQKLLELAMPWQNMTAYGADCIRRGIEIGQQAALEGGERYLGQ